MYYIDVDGGIDVTLGYQQSCCGTGHAKELYYTFGVTRNQVKLKILLHFIKKTPILTIYMTKNAPSHAFVVK